MRRVADFLLRNWPLKLGAVLLATVLYVGLVLGQNVRTWTGTLPIDAIRPPSGATLLTDLPPVRMVRYRAPLDVGVLSPDSFTATVDLSRATATAGGAPQTVPVTVIALDRRVQVVDYQPSEVEVRLDSVATRQFPVTVDLGTVPQGITVGPPQTDPSAVTVRGASSRVDSVASVVARVTIDASALNVDRDVDLTPVDSNGNQVPNVELDPTLARVRVAVAKQLANRTLPVVPQITGQPAAGYHITSVTVDPPAITVSGEEATVTQLETALTEPIDVSGRTSDLEAMVGYSLPGGVSVAGSDQVQVVISIAEQTGAQTFQVAVRLTGQSSGLSYSTTAGSADITLAGPVRLLDQVDPAALSATADLTGLTVGSHLVDVRLTPPDGLALVSIDPLQISVNVTSLATPSPSPVPSATL